MVWELGKYFQNKELNQRKETTLTLILSMEKFVSPKVKVLKQLQDMPEHQGLTLQ